MKSLLLILVPCCSLLFGIEAPDWVNSAPLEVGKTISQLHLDAYLKSKLNLKPLRVAILGHRYGEIQQANGEFDKGYLPPNAEFHFENHSQVPELGIDRLDDTDRRLAQVIWAMTGYDPDNAPQFLLYNANGALNFSRAVNAAIARDANVILSTERFNGYGNLNGTGPIHSLIQKAARRGILWIQSAGAHHRQVLRVPIACQTTAVYGNTVDLSEKTSGGVILESLADNQNVKISLSYNRWPNGTETSGTTDDLDLVVYEISNGSRVLVKSSRIQVMGQADKADTTLLPYEEVKLTLGRSIEGKRTYFVAVPCKRGNFNPKRDFATLVVETDKPVSLDDQGIEKAALILHSERIATSLLTPVDTVPGFSVSVGDNSRFGSRGTLPTPSGRELSHPEVLLEYALQEFSDGGTVTGADLAAARFTAAALLMRAHDHRLSPKHLYALSRLKSDTKQWGLDWDLSLPFETRKREKSLSWLGIEPSLLSRWLDENP